jgi:hypothetical protein
MATLTAQKLKAFADRITPPNWNICIGPRDHRYEPGTLNICLKILSEKEWCARLTGDLNGDFHARVEGLMHFYPISILKSRDPRAEDVFGKHGESLIGEILLELYPELGTEESTLDALVHELAHIAVVRRKAQKVGRETRFRQGEIDHDIEGESEEGPLFQRAFRLLIIRTEKVIGKECTEEMWRSLKVYESREGR